MTTQQVNLDLQPLQEDQDAESTAAAMAVAVATYLAVVAVEMVAVVAEAFYRTVAVTLVVV